jgi:predicted nucleic acid-binding protein
LENKGLIVGLDTDVLCYALDPAFPEHKSLSRLLVDLSAENVVALNPTVIHEAHHVLVFYLQWFSEEAAKKLSMLLRHPCVEFFNQTKNISSVAINLSVKHNLGGRDALIMANFLANKVPTIYTHDHELLKLQKISWRNNHVTFKDPVTETT